MVHLERLGDRREAHGIYLDNAQFRRAESVRKLDPHGVQVLAVLGPVGRENYQSGLHVCEAAFLGSLVTLHLLDCFLLLLALLVSCQAEQKFLWLVAEYVIKELLLRHDFDDLGRTAVARHPEHEPRN